MGKICQVDTFYVGFFREDSTIVFPYNFDGNDYAGPDLHTYGDHGLCAWILQHKRTYLWNQDDGKLLAKGYAFGDLEKRARDAVVIPLIESSVGTMKVIGKASMQSYDPRVYTAEHIRAFEWLARAVVTALSRERQDAINRLELGIPDDLPKLAGSSLSEILEDLCDKLQWLRSKIIKTQDHLPHDPPGAMIRLAELREACQQIQTETMAILTRPSLDGLDLLARLTSKEKEVASLLAAGLSNHEIAVRLHVSERTVKTHVSRILAKFEVKQRSGVAARLRPLM